MPGFEAFGSSRYESTFQHPNVPSLKRREEALHGNAFARFNNLASGKLSLISCMSCTIMRLRVFLWPAAQHETTQSCVLDVTTC